MMGFSAHAPDGGVYPPPDVAPAAEPPAAEPEPAPDPEPADALAGDGAPPPAAPLDEPGGKAGNGV